MNNENEKRELEVHSDRKGIEAFDQALQAEVNEVEVVDPEVVVEAEPEMSFEEAMAQMPTNIPYKKIYNDEGEWVNPITKDNPYRMPFMNRRDKKALLRKSTKHPKNNKRGIRLIVTPFGKGKFLKTRIVKQHIPAHQLIIADVESGDEVIMETRYHKAKTIIHNQMQFKNE